MRGSQCFEFTYREESRARRGVITRARDYVFVNNGKDPREDDIFPAPVVVVVECPRSPGDNNCATSGCMRLPATEHATRDARSLRPPRLGIARFEVAQTWTNGRGRLDVGIEEASGTLLPPRT